MSGNSECPVTLSPVKDLKDTYSTYRLQYNFLKILKALESPTQIQPHFLNGRQKNVYSEPLASTFQVRGSKYLIDGVKVSSAPSLFSLLGVENILPPKKNSPPLLHCTQHPSSYVQRLKTACKRCNISPPFVLVLNFVVPWGNFCAYFYRSNATGSSPFSQSMEECPSEKLWKTFLSSSDSFRKQSLKFIPKLINAPWFVSKVVGTSPAIIGNKLPVKYYGGISSNYLEISMNVASGNSVVNTITNTVRTKSDSVTIDLGFVIEGREKECLPEQMLATLRLNRIVL